MKKTYINPTMESFTIGVKQQILAGSLSKDSETTISNNNDVLGRDYDFDDEEEF